MLLFINSCPREDSRTLRVAKALLESLNEEYIEINLDEEKLLPLSKERLKLRDELVSIGKYDDIEFKYANEFANADKIVIAAPFWNLTFPSLLHIYLENIYVVGIVSNFDENGQSKGLCKAQKLYYVTTSGGPLIQKNSYELIKDLAINCFGIKDTQLISASMLDVVGYDSDKIIDDKINEIKKKYIKKQ